MRNKEIMDRTNNSTIYNRSRKVYLEVSKGLIHCSYCRYHKGENREGGWYGGFIEEGETLKEAKVKFPSWKLASKNCKQWMFKNNVEMKLEILPYRTWRKRSTVWVEFDIGKRWAKGIKYSKK